MSLRHATAGILVSNSGPPGTIKRDEHCTCACPFAGRENLMPAESWAPYTPDDKSPWDLRRVVHLHRRAGFAATWSEIERDLKDGPKASIDRALSGRTAME